jgi:hypothetical protein
VQGSRVRTEVCEADLEEKEGLLEQGGQRVVLGLRDVWVFGEVGHAHLKITCRHAGDVISCEL